MKRGWFREVGHLYFITNTVRFWLPVLYFEQSISLIYKSWEHFRQVNQLEFYAYIIMPNHLHYITFIPEGEFTLSDFQRDFKKFVSRGIHRILEKGRPDVHSFFSQLIPTLESEETLRELSHEPLKKNHRFTLWRDDEIPELIETEDFFEQKVNYIHLNPIRKGWVSQIEDYPLSSAYVPASGDRITFETDNFDIL